MRKYFVVIGIGIVAAIVVLAALGIISQRKVEATPITWTAERIEATALVYAQQMALQGTPTSIESKKMWVADFRLLLNPFDKGDLGTAEVWLVVFKGKVVVNHPSQYSVTSQTINDNMWVNLTPDGRVIGWGTLPLGTSLNLNGPLPTQPISWPTPVDQKR